MAYRTPNGLVRGLGSAHTGTGHYWVQRVNSIALLPLTVFIICLGIALAGADYDTVADTLGNPLVAVPVLLFVLINMQHMRLGLGEVIADYVHQRAALVTLLLLNTFFCYGLTAIAAFALLKLSLGV